MQEKSTGGAQLPKVSFSKASPTWTRDPPPAESNTAPATINPLKSIVSEDSSLYSDKSMTRLNTFPGKVGVPII